jgi:hypothetical protein
VLALLRLRLRCGAGLGGTPGVVAQVGYPALR